MGLDSAPLTFGQLSTLRHMQQWPAARWWEANLTREHVLAPGTDLARVNAALAAVARHHSSLRVTFDLSGPGEPRQILTSGAIEAQLVEGDATQVRDALVARTFDFANEVGWRGAVVVDDRGDPRCLVLSVSQLILDGWSLRHLDMELAPLRGEDTFDADHGTTSLRRTTELAREQHGDEWRATRELGERYWRTYLQALPEPVIQRLERGGSGASAPDAVSGTLHVNTRSVRLQELSRGLRIFPAGLLLGLLSLSLFEEAREEPRLPFALMAANRNVPEWRFLVATANQQVPLLLARPDAESVREYLTQVQALAQGAHRTGCYDVDMAEALCMEHLSFAPSTFGTMFNYTARGPVSEGTLLPADGPRIQVGPAEEGVPLDVFVQVSNEGFTISAARRFLDEAAVERILTRIDISLRALAEDADVRLSHLREGWA